MHSRAFGVHGKRVAQRCVRHSGAIVYERGEHGVVVIGQQFAEARDERRVGSVVWGEVRFARAARAHRSHRHDRRRQLCRNRVHDPLGVGAAAVDLVDEQQRRNAQALQRPQKHARLRLHTFDGGDHQHRAVEHVEHPLDFGDEIRMSRRVDQIDDDVVDDERHDRGLDGDAALPFEVESVGLCGAVVDAADRVDDVGFVEESLGEARLTRVYMCQNSQIQRSHGGSCPADGGDVPSR